MNGLQWMALIYGLVLAPIVAAIVRSLAVDWMTPLPNRSKEHMAWLREQARREGRYVELGDQ